MTNLPNIFLFVPLVRFEVLFIPGATAIPLLNLANRANEKTYNSIQAAFHLNHKPIQFNCAPFSAVVRCQAGRLALVAFFQEGILDAPGLASSQGGYFRLLFTASFNCLPALNLTPLVAGILIRLAV